MKIKAGKYWGGCGVEYIVGENGLIYVVSVPHIYDNGEPFRHHVINKDKTQKTFYDKTIELDTTDYDYEYISKLDDAIAECYYPVPDREIKGLPRKFDMIIDVAEDSLIYNI